MDNRVQDFFDAFATNDTIQRQVMELNSKYGQAPLQEQALDRAIQEDLIPLASAHGYPFTLEQFKAYGTQKRKTLEGLDTYFCTSNGKEVCMCIVGGGGKDPDENIICACVLGGGGKANSHGQRLTCVGFGDVG